MKKVMKRLIAVIPALMLQLVWYFFLFHWMNTWVTQINLLLSVLSVVFTLYIITKHDDATYKILWLLVILSFPIVGAFLYLIFGNKRTTRSLKKHLNEMRKTLPEIAGESEAAEISEQRVKQTFQYLESMTGFPAKKNEEAEYYPLGDDLFPAMLRELRGAEKYIFIEYFIVQAGYMWDSIVEILEQKVAVGVEIYVMYDDFGSIGTYSIDEAKTLEKKGIHCVAFNPLLFIRGTLNYRDHRKMLIIDGKTAFSGGVNLADEYINRIWKYGHWKDIGFCIRGEAVRSYTQMFVEFWNAFSGKKIPETLYEYPAGESVEKTDGFVLSYYDSPIRDENASNELYIELLSQAKETAYFFTPYLMLGDSLLEAFTRAAKRGVDVRIIMPGIPDKKMIFRMSKSFYPPLLTNGVRIYQYDPGFVHAKACVIDGEIGAIGTVNLDYRSLFLHFENNSFFYKASILPCIEKDFLATQEKCTEMKIGDNVKLTLGRWFVSGVLRIFSPLC